MEELPHEEKSQTNGERARERRKLIASVIVAVCIIALAWFYATGKRLLENLGGEGGRTSSSFRGERKNGASLSLRWGDLSSAMIDAGVIDVEKVRALYAARGADGERIVRLYMRPEEDGMPFAEGDSGVLLNLLWAFGLSNKSRILEEGPMTDPRYGGPARFASTGGWTLARGDAMDHYSKHEFVRLNPDAEMRVERVAKAIYRPCCDNATHFPDCNHGMAMLGLLELMAANGADEREMYDAALEMNKRWFPSQYGTIAQYLSSRGDSLATADAKEILGGDISSASGYRRILSQAVSPSQGGGAGCGV